MTTDEKIIDRVQKLLAKAEDKATTDEEAEAFFAKAYELMAQHAIDEAMVRSASNTQERINQVFVSISTSYYLSDIQLLAVVGKANNCAVLQVKRPGKGASGGIVVGFNSDVERTQLLYGQLLVHLTRVCKQQKTPTNWFGEPLPRNERAIYLRSVRFGFASRIDERFAEIKRVTEARTVAETPGVGLVLVEREEQLQRYLEAMGVRKARQTRSRADRAGVAEGRRAADSADLGQTRLGERRALGR